MIMEFILWLIYKTLLHLAIEKDNNEVVKNLLLHEEIDINIKTISYANCFNSIFFKYFKQS